MRTLWRWIILTVAILGGNAWGAAKEPEPDPEPEETPRPDRKRVGEEEDLRFIHGGMRLGPFELRPRFSTGVTYDDNIYISSSSQQDDFIWNISPGIAVGLGDFLFRDRNLLTFDYSPSILFYAHESRNNTVDHSFNLKSQYLFKRLKLGLDQDLRITSGGVIEAGERQETQTYLTSLSSFYELTGKMSMEINGSQSVTLYETLFDTWEWANRNWLNYQVLPKINAGIGVTLGYRTIQENEDQTYEQFLVRALYNISGKTDVSLSVGGEFRQYDGGGNDFGPVFEFRGNYQPFDPTTISISAFERNTSSATISGQNYTTTGFDVTIRQRFLQRIHLSVGGGYQHLDYEETTSSVAATREDKNWFLQVGVNWSMAQRWLMSLTYQHRDNDSSDVPFTNNQLGLQTTFTFNGPH